jgi:hypothetical protein
MKPHFEQSLLAHFIRQPHCCDRAAAELRALDIGEAGCINS